MTGLLPPPDGLDVRALLREEGMRLVLVGSERSASSAALRLLAGLDVGGAPVGAAYLPPVPYLFRGLVGWNLGLGLEAEPAALAALYARRLGLGDRLADPVSSPTGREAGLVGLARTMASPQPLVLLDEPLAHVVPAERPALAGFVVETLGGRTMVAAVAHPVDASALATHLGVLVGGRIRQYGPVAEVLAAPVDEDVARILAR